MKHNNIYLVGFMGCGKTSVLKKIRQKIQSNTFDLDENIEKKHGSISKIFESKGEKYFRQIELETFQMLPKNDSVVATVDKTVKKNRDLINSPFYIYFFKQGTLAS